MVCEENCSLFHYVQKSDDQLILEVKRACVLHKSQTIEDFRPAKLLDECLTPTYVAKPLHGYYERICNTVWNSTTTFYWFSIESEGLLLAAQEQSLSIRAMATVYGTNVSTSCRLCGEHPETLEHLVSGCTKLAGALYNDCVLKYLHWLLCRKHSFNCCIQWWNHAPALVTENDQVKILWDFNIFVIVLLVLAGLILLLLTKQRIL